MDLPLLRVPVTLLALLALAALLVAPAAPAAGQDAPPGPVDRLDGGDPIAVAVQVSQRRITAEQSIPGAVLATTADFADAMTGSSLLGTGPLLLTGPAQLDPRTAAELQRAVQPGGLVRILGGELALSAQVEADVQALGLQTRRVAGPTRLHTAVAVAVEMQSLYGAPQHFLLARAFAPPGNPTAAWADAISAAVPAGRHGWPILLTDTAELSQPTADHLAVAAGIQVYIVGGTAAISGAVAAEVARGDRYVNRLAGATRDGTAARIADSLLSVSAAFTPRSAIVFDGYADDGWAYGLAAAGLGVFANAPLLPLSPTDAALESARVIACGTEQASLVAAGSADVLPDAVIAAHQSCPPPAVEPLVLSGDGLGPDLSFGLAPDPVIAALSDRLGPPQEDTGWIVGCPFDGDEANERTVSFGSLHANFYDDGVQTFSSWTYRTPDDLGLQTDRGIGLGSTNADVRATHPGATLEDDVFGPLWTIPHAEGGPMYFSAASTADADTVDGMFGGAVIFCD